MAPIRPASALRRGVALAGLWLALTTGCQPGSSAPAFDDVFLADEPVLYTQHREEVIIRHFFRDRRDGVFVDVGAYHWKELSTTLYLEERLGWSGIAIDANRGWASGYAEHRPATRFRSVLIGAEEDREAVLYIEPASPGTASASKESVERTLKALNPGLEDVDVLELPVHMLTLDRLLAREGVETFDFLSMDIEGYELEALAGFDIERFRPALVCIEILPRNLGTVDAWFRERGYRELVEYRRHDPVNRYYAPAPEPAGA